MLHFFLGHPLNLKGTLRIETIVLDNGVRPFAGPGFVAQGSTVDVCLSASEGTVSFGLPLGDDTDTFSVVFSAPRGDWPDCGLLAIETEPPVSPLPPSCVGT